VICSKHFKPHDFALPLDFREDEEILLTPWLKQDEFGIISFPSIHAAVVASNLRNSSQAAQSTKTEEWREFLSECSLP